MRPEQEVLDKYIRLCRDFIEKTISCDEFRTRFFNLNGMETATEPDDALKLVDSLFFSVEMCEPDTVLLKGLIAESPDMGYLNEDQLRAKVSDFIMKAKVLKVRRK